MFSKSGLIVAAAVLLAVNSSSLGVELKVDFGVGDVPEFVSTSPNDVQAGFDDFSVDANLDGIAGVLDLATTSEVTSRVFSGVTVSVEFEEILVIDEIIGFFDGPDELDPLGDLKEDGVSGLDAMEVTVSLSDLPAGPYQMTTYHYASELIVVTAPEISMDVFFDAGGGESLVAADVSPGVNELAAIAIPFTANGTQDVTLRIGGPSPWINGFTLVPVPEPTGWLLLALGMAGLFAARRLRRSCV